MRNARRSRCLLVVAFAIAGSTACSSPTEPATQAVADEVVEGATDDADADGAAAVDAEEVPTAPPEAATMVDDAGEEPDEAPTTIAQATLLAGPPRGMVRCEDGSGDVLNLDTGAQIEGGPLAGTDLSRVTFSMDTDAARVIWESAEDIAGDAGTDAAGGPAAVQWALKVWDGEDDAYLLEVQLIGSAWSAAAFDWRANQNQAAPAPSIIGNQIMATYPLADLTPLEGPVTWAAHSEQDGGAGFAHDTCPNATELYPPIDARLTLP